jgi:putative transposase
MSQSDAPGSEDTPTAFDTAQFQKQLQQHIKAAGGTVKVGGEAFLQQIVKATLQALLDAEMTEHLGYEPHAVAGKGAGNSRNGRGSKKVRGDFGQLTLQPPRDRNGSFDPQIVPKREANLGNFSGKVVSLYARGLTTREIQDHLKEMYQIEISPEFVSRVTAKVQEEVLAWQNRPLHTLYPIVYVDGMFVSVRDGEGSGKVIKKCLYTVLGIDCSGRQDVLGLWIAENEGARFWLKVFNDLQARGVKDVLILCGDGLSGLPEAVSAAFPKTDVQLCVVHQIRSATRFVCWKNRKAFCADMRRIYTAPTLEAAEAALEDLDHTWGKQYPMAIASWRSHWTYLSTFFRYPVELRTPIYTTNSIENLHGRLRKNTRNRKIFPNDEAAIRLHYLNIRNITKKWRRRNGWDTVMNQLALLFPERLSPEVLASN